MLSIALLVAVGATSLVVPASSVASGAAIAVCFSPVGHARGVDVRLIAHKTSPCRRANGIGALADVGVPIWTDDQPRIAHAKTMVIDGAVTLMGSYNWTTGAAQNSEDLNLVSSATVAGAMTALPLGRLRQA